MKHLITAAFIVCSVAANAVDINQETIAELASLGALNIACAGGDKEACSEADKMDRQVRHIKESGVCLDPQTSAEAMLCGFVEGYVAEAK